MNLWDASDSSQLVFQVKSGKSSLEQISRVYGNQVISLSSCKCMHAHNASIHGYSVEMICTVSGHCIKILC